MRFRRGAEVKTELPDIVLHGVPSRQRLELLEEAVNVELPGLPVDDEVRAVLARIIDAAAAARGSLARYVGQDPVGFDLKVFRAQEEGPDSKADLLSGQRPPMGSGQLRFLMRQRGQTDPNFAGVVAPFLMSTVLPHMARSAAVAVTALDDLADQSLRRRRAEALTLAAVSTRQAADGLTALQNRWPTPPAGVGK